MCAGLTGMGRSPHHGREMRGGGTVACWRVGVAMMLGGAAGQCMDDPGWRFHGLDCAAFVAAGGPGEGGCQVLGVAPRWTRGTASDGSLQTAYDACQVSCGSTECALQPCVDDAGWRFNGIGCAEFASDSGPGVVMCRSEWLSGVATDGSDRIAYEACPVACANREACGASTLPSLLPPEPEPEPEPELRLPPTEDAGPTHERTLQFAPTESGGGGRVAVFLGIIIGCVLCPLVAKQVSLERTKAFVPFDGVAGENLPLTTQHQTRGNPLQDARAPPPRPNPAEPFVSHHYTVVAPAVVKGGSTKFSPVIGSLAVGEQVCAQLVCALRPRLASDQSTMLVALGRLQALKKELIMQVCTACDSRENCNNWIPSRRAGLRPSPLPLEKSSCSAWSQLSAMMTLQD